MPAKKVVVKVEKKKISKKTPKSTNDIPKSRIPANAFPVGNQLWKQRAKHGRDYLFKDPAKLWEAAVEYFTWCDNNPLSRNEPVKFEGMMSVEEVEVGRPYTLTGFCFYIRCAESYFRRFDYEQAPPDLITVVEAILATVRDQQISGAIVNIFNGPLVSKLNDLVEKTDITTKGEAVGMPTFNILNNAPTFARAEKDVDTKRLT